MAGPSATTAWDEWREPELLGGFGHTPLAGA